MLKIGLSTTRTKNSLYNVITGIGGYIITNCLSFVVVTMFIKTLGRSYLGLNGLFSNIIAVLALSELGIGTAINYNLYKLIATDNKEKIIDYMRAYKVFYRIIALVIFTLGLLVIPFLDFIIKEKPNIPENIILIYMLFLANTCFSYLLTYKRSLVIAHQKLSIVNSVTTVVTIVISCIQIILLKVFGNYILYLCIQISISILSNTIISIISDRLYPYLKEKGKPLTKDEKKSLFANVRALMIYRVSDTVAGSTSNILISKFIGIDFVGLYSNYSMIIGTVRTVVLKILEAVVASIGNLNATASKEKSEEVFRIYWLITFWIYGITTTCLMNLFQPFICFWIGCDYLLNDITMISIVTLYFIVGMMIPVSNYRTTMGLFRQGQLRPLIMVFVNITLSIALIKPLGIAGVFIGTIISKIVVQAWFDPWIVYKYGFERSVKPYYVTYLKYVAIMILTLLISDYLCKLVALADMFQLLYILFISVMIPNLIFFILFYKTKEFCIIKNKATSLLKKEKNGERKNED